MDLPGNLAKFMDARLSFALVGASIITFLLNKLPTEAAGLLGTHFLEATGAAINSNHCLILFSDTGENLRRTVVRPRSAKCSVFKRGKEGHSPQPRQGDARVSAATHGETRTSHNGVGLEI